ncbi:hypothetical protein BT96DRAFT_842544, partial [Gymnopus androsaceus JB14]
FKAGDHGLQAYHARAIQSQLHMMVHNSRGAMYASERAAESQGFSTVWGGRMVHMWVQKWIADRTLPGSMRGCHAKVFSFLEDPTIRAELRSYLRTNKWAMDPTKLCKYMKTNVITPEAQKYIQGVVNTEMPKGLIKYLETELFPCIQLKRHLVPTPQDEMTAQANDGKPKSWVLEGEHALKKKGVGCGLHQSDCNCSMVGWLKEASQTLEYGKNYDGYWNGELFVKQLIEQIIPAFERAHGAGYRALIMVDHSQGHSAYSNDALLAQWMNLNPGGKQACMRSGWFIRGSQKIIQPMIFAQNHAEFPDKAKGMKQVLIERVKKYLRDHCDYSFNTLQQNMSLALESVHVHTIRRWEHRMFRWMEAYRSGLDAKSAQFQVRAFSSRQYKSHRQIPETLAAQMDM